MALDAAHVADEGAEVGTGKPPERVAGPAAGRVVLWPGFRLLPAPRGVRSGREGRSSRAAPEQSPLVFAGRRRGWWDAAARLWAQGLWASASRELGIGWILRLTAEMGERVSAPRCVSAKYRRSGACPSSAPFPSFFFPFSLSRSLFLML